MTTYWCRRAVLPDGGVSDGVVVKMHAGRIESVTPGGEPPAEAIRLAGLTIPGFANCHSHAFHRALRGRTQRGRGTFWTWREQMYELAGRLDPDSYRRLARAVYREMAAAGITSVGEFHYLHHGPGGTPYDDPNETGIALVEAARDVGLRITLLDTCYLAAGIGQRVEGVQRRFSDGDVAQWAARTDRLDGYLESAADDGVVVGAAAHSVRAVPDDQLAEIAEWARHRGRPLHFHLSEQPAENDACRQAHGRTPTQVFAERGLLGPATSAVHATHLTADDVRLLGSSSTVACFCPTTERDLADGVGPAPSLETAGSPLTLGSDSHAVIDPFEEMRALELDERLIRRHRGHWQAARLLAIGTTQGHASLGFTDAGRIEAGARADLVTVDTESPRTAGTGAGTETVVFAAAPADIVQVVCDGRVVYHRDDALEVGNELAAAVAAAWGEE